MTIRRRKSETADSSGFCRLRRKIEEGRAGDNGRTAPRRPRSRLSLTLQSIDWGVPG
jgi:hypothetical protein